MKRIVMAVLLVAGLVQAEMVILEGRGPTLTTGDLLDEADENGLTANVVEIAGLKITARSGGPDQDVNCLTESMGIDSDGSGDNSGALENGELLVISFSKEVQINQFDFNQFSSGEVVNISIDDMPLLQLEYEALSNRRSAYLDTNIVVGANVEIEFYTTGTSTVGLDGIDVTVLGGSGEVSLSISSSNSMTYLSAEIDGAAAGNHILQSCTNITSNVWNTVFTFAEDTNWLINPVKEVEYFRAIIE